MLQRVHHLVREDQTKLDPVTAFDAIQRAGFRIVVAGDLLGVEVEQQPLEIERIRQQPEETIGRLHSFPLRAREFLVEPALDVALHRFLRHHLRARSGLEGEPHRLFHRWPERVDDACDLDRASRHFPAARREGEQSRNQAPHLRPPR